MGFFDVFRRDKAERDARKLVKDMALLAFPEGPDQIEREASELFRRLGGNIPHREVKEMHCRTKFLAIISEDKSEARIISSIIAKSQGRFSAEEAKITYEYISECLGDVPAKTPRISENPARADAVVINSRNRFAGIAEEYAWIEARYGKRGVGWELVMQMHMSEGDRSYDVLDIRTREGRDLSLSFDITAFDRPVGRRR